MAARQARLISVVVLAAAACAGVWQAGSASFGSGGRASSDQAAQADAGNGRVTSVRRIVSLVPAVTETLFVIGAGPRVVGVSSFDSFPAEVRTLPRLGALLDPDTERILALRPDLVVVYGSQEDLRVRIERAGIRTFRYRHAGIQAVFDTIREIGAVTGELDGAARLERELRTQMKALSSRVTGRRRPRTLLVFERQPRTLRSMYASGGIGFLHEMLAAAGGENVFGDVAAESVQPSHETVLARAPEVILEVRAAGLLEPGALEADREVWATLSSLPAVRNRRVHFLLGDQLVVPGPRLVQGIESFARALHPEAFR